MHDSVGQLLFRLAIDARELHQRVADIELAGAAAAARSIETSAAEAIAELRNVMHALANEADSLPAAVRSTAVEISERTPVAIEVVVSGETYGAPRSVDQTLRRITAEALHNVEKHACATAAVVSLEFLADRIVVTVDDDGVGLQNGPAVDGVDRTPTGLGLPDLQQRVSALGGTLELSNNEDGGARIRATVPIPMTTP